MGHIIKETKYDSKKYQTHGWNTLRKAVNMRKYALELQNQIASQIVLTGLMQN